MRKLRASEDAPTLLGAMGVVAWTLGGILAFTDHSDGAASAFIGSGLVLFLVAAYFDRIEEAGPGGIKVGPKVDPVPPDNEEALEPTPDETEIEAPAGTTPIDEPAAEDEDGSVQVFENLADIPTATVAALFRSVDELTQSEARFNRARRRRGRGNNPWLFEFVYPDDSRKAWRVSWGGQSKRSATVDRHAG